jgi:alkaline phosphatase
MKRYIALSLALFASALLSSSCSTEAGAKAPGAPHVILFIGDGMGYSSELLASRFLYGDDSGLAWRSFPFVAWATTWDVDTYDRHAAASGEGPYDEASLDPSLGYDSSLHGSEPWPLSAAADDLGYLTGAVTDSAAAATAMATGRKTQAGRIAWSRGVGGDPGSSLETLPELMRARLGSEVGVVTTVPFNHATPAAFAAHAPARSSYADIAGQMTGTRAPNILIGGGHPSWNATYYGAGEFAALKSSGLWQVAERSSGADGSATLDSASSLGLDRGLFGLFGGTDGAMEAPVPQYAVDPAGAPAFARDAENPSLARIAVAAARRMAASKGGFFLMAEQGDIDWANHANDLTRMLGAMHSLDEAVRAIEAWVDEPGDEIDWGNTLLIVTADHATGLPRFGLPATFGRGERPVVSYATTGHGNELVTVAARGDRAEEVFGPFSGAYRPGTRIMDDTDLYRAMRAFAGL